MDIRPPSLSLRPFARHRVKVVAKDPAGSAADYVDTLEVAILYGQTPSQSAGTPMQTAVADAVTIIFSEGDWHASFQPSLGHVISNDDLGKCTVQQAQKSGERWYLTCTRNMRAKS